MWIWNLGVAGGMAAVYVPTFSGTGPLAEFPTAFDGLLLLGLLMVNGAFWLTLLAAPQRLPYISLWFFGLALLTFMGAYALGAAAQAGDWLISLDDTVVALVNAFVARLILTFWVIGVALGSLFYVVPRATFNALASGGMAFASWILWAGLSGVSALGALVDPSVPYVVTSHRQRRHHPAAGADLPGRGHAGHDDARPLVADACAGTLAFALLSMSFLLSTACSRRLARCRPCRRWCAERSSRPADHPGHPRRRHLRPLRLADHAAPRLLRRDWGDSILTDVQLWATFLGATVAGLSLMGAGIVHGSLIADGAPRTVNGTLIYFRLAAPASARGPRRRGRAAQPVPDVHHRSPRRVRVGRCRAGRWCAGGRRRRPAPEPMTVHTPIETRSRTIPPWAIGITVLIFLVGGVYLAGNLAGENPPIGGVPSPSGSAGGGPTGRRSSPRPAARAATARI